MKMHVNSPWTLLTHCNGMSIWVVSTEREEFCKHRFPHQWDDLWFPSRPAFYIDCLLPRWHHQPAICPHTHLIIIIIMTQANFLSSPLCHLYYILYHFLFRTTQLHSGYTRHMVEGKIERFFFRKRARKTVERKSNGYWAPVTGRRTRSEMP